MRRLIYGVMTAGMTVSLGFSQSIFDNASFRTMSLGGIHLYGVSAYSGYSTLAQPGGFDQSSFNIPGRGSDIDYGVSTSVGWQRHKPWADFVVFYNANYGGFVRYSDASALSQSLSLSVSRRLSPRWTLNVSASGSDMTTAQFIYQPSNLSLASQSQATFDDLAAASGLGQFSSSQAASTLTAIPTLESPARSILLGDRILSYSGVIGLTYAHSSRLTFHISSFTAAGQHRNSDSDRGGQNYVMPRSFGVNAGMGWSYMLSPRTQLGVDVEGDRILNHYQSGYTTSFNGSIGRKLSQRWFISVHAGGSTTRLTKQTLGTPMTAQVVGGGSIGFRTYQHTLLGTYDRSASDPFGLALGTTTMTNAAWTWHRLGSRWSVFTSFGQQQVRNTGYTSLSGWQASAGMSQTLTSHTRMALQYAYLRNKGEFLQSASDYEIHSVRLSFSWAPQASH